MDIADRYHRLLNILTGMESVVVGFSAGVDSTFLLGCSLKALGKDKVLAATALSETFPTFQSEEARSIAQSLGADHHVFHTRELEIEGFKDNPPDRCYFCKHELYSYLVILAEKKGYRHVIDGTNLDDEGDHRPGRRALEELGIRSPLREAGLGKGDIRLLSKQMSLPTWDKPSFACLSSRFPYGDTITPEKLRMVEAAEEFIRGLGFRQLRVRHHGDTARIEVEPADINRLTSEGMRSAIVEKLKSLGYRYVSVDLQGYRTGSLNEVLRSGRGEEYR
ncbi:MAG: TIGR00268 family protein [Candidatus Glassbacteria bacterium RBG_16_58_8]|uniref:TIGR00268 family protein n=1 Tax=Candidatus Glassbacteria bacterium RBG_16_58_8 TaxID=1817866 RepID=A0A1F5YBP7_9BACT|nr:MAG: TIGR00268 family protein [Candidatus Glassbacteria bacterium RBG_16_58_8]